MAFWNKIRKKIWFSSIRYQLIVGVTIVQLLLMTFFVFDLTHKQSNFLKQQSLNDVQNLAETFAVNANLWMLANDWEGLEEVVLSHKDFPNLEYAMIVSKDGTKVLAHSNPALIGRKINDNISRSLAKQNSISILVNNDDILDIAVPIINNKKELLGWARVCQNQAFIKKGLEYIIINGIAYIIIAIIIACSIAIIITHFLTNGLNNLVSVTEQIRTGNRNVRANQSAIVEISKLGSSINLMLDAVNASESRFRSMFQENTAIMLLVDPIMHNIIDANRSAVRFYGYSFEDLCKKSFKDLTTTSTDDININIKKILERKCPSLEAVHLTRSGEVRNVEVNVSIIEDQNTQLLFCVIQDVTERKIAQDNLQQTLKEVSDYKYALDQSADISITDANGIIKYVNARFCKISKYSSNELVGQTHKKINAQVHNQQFWKNFWDTIKAGKVFTGEVCNKAKDGSYFWSDVTVIPFLDANGNIEQYLAIRYDITEKRKLEQDLINQKQYQQKLLTETIIEAQESERDFLGRELHDNINQLLVSVKLHLAAYRAKLETKAERIEISYSCIDEAIKEVRKLSHTLVIPNLDKLSLKDALENLIQIYRSIKAPGTYFLYELKSDLVLENKMQLMLYRIVQEQMNNIHKYAKAKMVVIMLKVEGDQLLLHVIDDGIGFDTTKETNGIGLLNIQSRVEFYSGKMNVISSPGNGCKLEINIPLSKAQQKQVSNNTQTLKA